MRFERTGVEVLQVWCFELCWADAGMRFVVSFLLGRRRLTWLCVVAKVPKFYKPRKRKSRYKLSSERKKIYETRGGVEEKIRRKAKGGKVTITVPIYSGICYQCWTAGEF